MTDPRISGISGITDKLVVVRHAREEDLVNIRRQFGAKVRDVGDLHEEDVVVALEDERLIGFGVLMREAGAPERACIKIIEDRGRKGIGRSVVEHLVDHAEGVRSVAAARAVSGYLAARGFVQRSPACADGPGGDARLVACCGVKEGELTIFERERA